MTACFIILEKQMKRKDILERLNEYCASDYVPMHMPGAKRNTALFHMENPYGIDITEIEGFDNLHHAEGLLAEAALRASKLFGADETCFLVNGSSAGILSAVCGATHKNGTVIIARNSHRSVYNAIYLNELNPVYVYPGLYVEEAGICGAILPDQIEAALKTHPEAETVVITSPTYEGMVSDIKSIAEIVHRHGAVLIVDEAHGAHLNFHPVFPESAVLCGADAVVQSIHKTLPSFTQTALLHLNGPNIDRNRVKRYWDMYQTTSPSYILMAGIDRCMTILEEQGKALFSAYAARIKRLRDRLTRLKHIQLIETDDISKIVLAAENGRVLYDQLCTQYHVQLEMASLKYVIAMTSIGDTDDYYMRFAEALEKIDNTMSGKWNARPLDVEVTGYPLKPVNTIYDALNSPSEPVELHKAAGRISAVEICFYPPGIPLVNPGERITDNFLRLIHKGLNGGLEVIGVKQNQKGENEILCLK